MFKINYLILGWKTEENLKKLKPFPEKTQQNPKKLKQIGQKLKNPPTRVGLGCGKTSKKSLPYDIQVKVTTCSENIQIYIWLCVEKVYA